MNASRRCHSIHLSGRKEGLHGHRPAASSFPPHPGGLSRVFSTALLNLRPLTLNNRVRGCRCFPGKEIPRTKHPSLLGGTGGRWLTSQAARTSGSRQAPCFLRKATPLQAFKFHADSSLRKTKKVNTLQGFIRIGYINVPDHNMMGYPTFLLKGFDKGMNVLEEEGMQVLDPPTLASSSS